MTEKYHTAYNLFWDIKYLKTNVKNNACYIAGISPVPGRRARKYRDDVAAVKAEQLVSDLIRLNVLKAEARLLCNK